MDDCGNSTTHDQIITVLDNTPPTFTAPADATLEKDDFCLYDPENPLAGNVTDEADNCSTGLNATHTDMITDTPCDGALTVTRTWSLTDDCGNVTTHTQIIDIVDTTPPVLGALASVELECGTPPPSPAATIAQYLLLPNATANDNCSPGSLSLLGVNTSAFIGDDCTGVITRTYYVADGCANSASAVQTFNVSDNLGPVLTEGEIATCFESVAQAVAAAVAATALADNCTPLASLDLDTDVAIARGGCDSLITLTVTDLCGNSSTAQYEVAIGCQTVRLKVYLEGAYKPALNQMDTTLNFKGLLPGETPIFFLYTPTPAGQPYTVAPWNYVGNLGLQYGDGMGDIPYPTDVVDWILVQVREEGILPANTIWTCAGWVHKDGTVTFPENVPQPVINTNNDYYIVVQHRHHLGILSPSFVNIECDGAFLNWDFTTSNSYQPLFRFGQKELEPGVWGMFTGSGEQITSISAISSPDRTTWKVWQGFNSYNPGDYIMTGFTDSGDETAWKNNQNRTSGVVFY